MYLYIFFWTEYNNYKIPMEKLLKILHENTKVKKTKKNAILTEFLTLV